MRDSFSKVNGTHFSPNHFKFLVSAQSADTLKLMQMNFPLWTAWVNGGKVAILSSELIQIALEQGKYEVDFEFGSKKIRWLLYLNFIIWGVFGAATAFFSLSKRF
jgi:hypothetical protein